MKIKFKKLLALVLVLTLCMSTMSVLSPLVSARSAVSYPSRDVSDKDYARNKTYYTSESKLQKVIDNLDGTLQGSDFASLLGLENTLDVTVMKLIKENLYNDKFITDLMKALFPTIVNAIRKAINDNAVIDVGITKIDLRSKANEIIEDLAGGYGLYLFPKDLAKVIYQIDPVNFGSVAYWLTLAGTEWDYVPWDSLVWNITDMDSWVKGLACIVGGFQPAIWALLQGKYYDHEETALSFGSLDGDVRITADANLGYLNSILPLLETVCGQFPVDYTYKGVRYTSLMDAASYYHLYDPVDMVAHIVYPIFTMIENYVAKQPIKYIADLLPQLAWAIYNGKLFHWLNGLQTNIGLRVSINGKLVNIKDVFKTSIAVNVWDLLSDQFEGLNIFSVSDIINWVFQKMDLSIKLPPIDTNYVANLGDYSTFPTGQTKVVADEPGMLLYLLRYAGTLCADENFVNTLKTMISPDEPLPEAVDAIIKNMAKDPDRIICALVELVCPQSYDLGTLFTQTIKAKDVSYSTYWTKANAQLIESDLDNFADSILLLATGKTVKQLVGGLLNDTIYTNNILNTLVISVRDLLLPLERVTNLLHIDITPWLSVTPETTWGFEDGNKAGFVNALTDALSPLNGLLKLLLAGDNLTLMNDNLTVLGYQGYGYGIVPLLEAIGCNQNDIATPQEYLSHIQKDEASIIRDILVPILNLAERIINEPVTTVLNILPNIIYFIETGSFQTAIENALKAVFVLLDNVTPIYDIGLNLDLSFKGIIKMVTGALGTGGNETFISSLLEKLDVTALLQGSVVKGKSNNGTDRYYIEGNNADTLTVLLRTVVNLLFSGNNEDGFTALLSKSLSGNTMIKRAAVGVIEGLDDMYNEDLGADKVISLLYYIYSMGSEAINGDYSVVADLINRLDYLLDALKKNDNDYIVRFLETVAEAIKDGTVNVMNTQSSNIEGYYTVSTSLGLKNVTDGVDFSDTLLPMDPSTYPKDISPTHQGENDSTAALFVDRKDSDAVDIENSGMHISASLNNIDANDVKMYLSLRNPADSIPVISDSAVITTAKGEQITYSLKDTDSPLNSDNAPFTAVGALKGKLPQKGDSAVLRVVLVTEITGKDANKYTVYSYTDLTIATVDTTELSETAAVYVAPEDAYTDSYAMYEFAKKNADEALSLKTTSQADIDAANSVLSSSISSLVYNDEITEKVNALSELTPVNKKTYTAAKSAVKEARNAFADAKAILRLCSGETADKFRAAQKDYDAYVNSLGADSYVKSEPSYPSRKPYAGDVARKPYETYDSDAQTFSVLATKLDNILGGSDFKTLTGLDEPIGDMVSAMVLEKVCDDSIVSAAVKALYPTVCNLLMQAAEDYGTLELFGKEVSLTKLIKDLAQEVLNKYGIALFPVDLASVLEKADAITYSSNIKLLKKAGTNWNAVDFSLLDWHVYNIDTLIKALGDSLNGVYPLLKAVLTGEDFDHTDRVYSLLTIANLDVGLKAAGCLGYDKVLLPILELLCGDDASYTYLGKSYSGLMSPEDYDALEGTDELIAHIILPLFNSLVRELNTSPVNYVLDLLPNIAALFSYDKLTSILYSLETIVGISVDVDIVGNIFETQLEFNVGNLVGDKIPFDLGDLNSIISMLSEKIGIELPETDAKFLFRLGELEQKPSVSSRGTYGYVKADRGAVLYDIINYLFNVVGNDDIMDKIFEFVNVDVNENETLVGIIKALGENGNDIAAALCELVVPSSGYGYTPVYTGKLEPGKVTYSKYWTQEMANDVSGNIDGFVNQITTLLGMPALGQLLEEKLSGKLYTNKNIATVISVLNNAVRSFDVDGKVLKVLRIDTKSWDGITKESTFGFADGDKDAFINKLTELLRPLSPLVRCLLANEDFSVLNYNITIKGSAGYSKGLIPILQAIGCNTDEMVTGAQYISDVYRDTDNAIKDILVPIMGLLERVYDAPIDTLLDIIPNLLYYIYNGNVNNAITNLIHTAYVLLDTIRPVFDLEFSIDVSQYLEENLIDFVNEKIAVFGISLPEDFTLKKLMTGYVSEEYAYDSVEKRTYLHDRHENTLTAVLRMFIDAAFADGNVSGVKKYLYLQENMTPELRQLVSAVLDGLEDIKNSEHGTDKILGIIYKIYSIGNTYFESGSIPETILDNWKQVVSIFLKSDEAYIQEFIVSIYGELCDYVKAESGTDIEEVVPEETITFFMKIKLFFQRIFDFIKHLFVP